MPPELYGPFGALAVLSFVVLAVIRGDIVPGYIYRAAVLRAEKADTAAEKTAEALSVLAKAAANGNGVKHG
jgi:hypothetical protein